MMARLRAECMEWVRGIGSPFITFGQARIYADIIQGSR